MEGVKIISTTTIYETFLSPVPFIILLILVFSISLFIFAINILVKKESIFNSIIEGTLALLFSTYILMIPMVGISQIYGQKKEIKYKEYKVEVSEEVNLEEFFKKYSFVSDEGDNIFIVREYIND